MIQKELTGRWFVDDVRCSESAPLMAKKLAVVMSQIQHTVLDAEEVKEVIERLKSAQAEYYAENKRLKKLELFLDVWGADDNYAGIYGGVHVCLRLIKVNEYHW